MRFAAVDLCAIPPEVEHVLPGESVCHRPSVVEGDN